MGAYLSHPVTTKYSESGKSDTLAYGATAMQGWRVSQEDAHNCILNFDENCSYFAVYDGHGGNEVSEYASKTFPEFIKANKLWSNARLGQALEEAFLKFDEHLLKPEILEELKRIAGIKKDENEMDETDEDKALLYEEAYLPLEDVLKKYGIRFRFERGGEEQFISPKLSARKTNAENKKVSSTTPKTAVLSNHNKNGELAVVGNPSPPSSPDESAAVATFIDSENKIEKTPTLKRARNGAAKKLYDETADCQDGVAVVSNSAGVEDSGDCPSPKRSKQNADAESDSDAPCVKSFVKENGFVSKEDAVSTTTVDEHSKPNSVGSISSKDEVKTEASVEENPPIDVSANKKTMLKKFPTKFNKQTVTKLLSKSNDSSTNEDKDCVEVSEEDETEDEEYQAELDEEEDSSGETEEDSVEEDEVVDEEAEEGAELDEEEEGEEEDMFPVPSGETPGVDSGTTACVAIIKGNTIYVANAGDSRCVLCRKDDVAVDLSADHKPEDLTERQRIEKAGGTITGDGRVNGGLNLSRAIGDHFYKKNTDLPLKDQMITALPDIRAETLLSTDKFLVLACDGIWNSMSSQEVVDFISLRLKNGLTPSKICEQLCDSCLAPSTAGDGTGCDNMTAIIVNFQRNAESISTTANQQQSPAVNDSASTAEANDNHFCSSTQEAT